MKRLLILIISISSSLVSYGQISSYSSASKRQMPVSAGFDSTKVQWADNIAESFIGQVLIGYCDHEWSNYVSGEFYTKNDINDKNRYMGNGYTKTKKEAIEGKSFIVSDVQKNSLCYMFELKEQNSNSKSKSIWYKWDGIFNGPFIVLSYYNYLKANYIGKKIIPIRRTKPDVRNTTFYINATDLKTGEEIIYDPTDIWECIDISQIDGRGDLVAILKNQRDNTSYISVSQLLPAEYYGHLSNSQKYKKMVIFYEDFVNLLEKYGLEKMMSLQLGKVEVGMSKELLYIIKGLPNKINRSSYGDAQYVYEIKRTYTGIDLKTHTETIIECYYINEETDIITAWN